MTGDENYGEKQQNTKKTEDFHYRSGATSVCVPPPPILFILYFMESAIKCFVAFYHGF